MDYQLNLAVPIGEAVRRVAFSELEHAHTDLASPDRHTGVHRARKCLKRLRSLLLLMRPGLPEPAYQTLKARVTVIAKSLAPAREAHALYEALGKLGGDAANHAALSHSLREWLLQRREVAERTLEGRAAAAMRALLELRPSFAGLAVYPDNFRSVAEGLWRSYRGTRRAFHHALASDADDDHHDWRKGVQQHWRHMQLLAPCWPSELTARVGAARSLSQLLGDDHDVALLRQLVSAPTLAFGSPEEIAAFLKRCRKRQRRLWQKPIGLGERLFIERARPFAERIETYWLTASEGEKDIVEHRADNIIQIGGMRTGRGRLGPPRAEAPSRHVTLPSPRLARPRAQANPRAMPGWSY